MDDPGGVIKATSEENTGHYSRNRASGKVATSTKTKEIIRIICRSLYINIVNKNCKIYGSKL